MHAFAEKLYCSYSQSELSNFSVFTITKESQYLRNINARDIEYFRKKYNSASPTKSFKPGSNETSVHGSGGSHACDLGHARDRKQQTCYTPILNRIYIYIYN